MTALKEAAGAVVWLTGRPASGKSTLARYLSSHLRGRGAFTIVLDSDAMRGALVPLHGYDDEGRDQFYETLANLAALLSRQGVVVIVAATAHRRAYRERAARVTERFLEVWIDVPAEECALRDPKGLYARAAHGEIPNFPGLDEVFEAPEAADVHASGGEDVAALEKVARLLA